MFFVGRQHELENRRLLSTSGVERRKLSQRHRRNSAAGDNDDDDDDDDDSDEDDGDECLTDINDCRCQSCHKICFLSAVSCLVVGMDSVLLFAAVTLFYTY